MRKLQRVALNFLCLIASLTCLASPTQAFELNFPTENLTNFFQVIGVDNWSLFLNLKSAEKEVVNPKLQDESLALYFNQPEIEKGEVFGPPVPIKKIEVEEEEIKKAPEVKAMKVEPTASPKVSKASEGKKSEQVTEDSVEVEEKETEEIKAVEAMINPGGLDPEKLFGMANNYRAQKGLKALEKEERVCKLAQERAPEIAAEINGGYMHRGMKERNLPYWNSENVIGMNSEERAFNWWISDYIHRIQIEGDFKYSCVACQGYYCVQEFTNFTPKG